MAQFLTPADCLARCRPLLPETEYTLAIKLIELLVSETRIAATEQKIAEFDELRTRIATIFTAPFKEPS